MDDHFEPWRKQGFICKPFAGDLGDGDNAESQDLSLAEVAALVEVDLS